MGKTSPRMPANTFLLNFTLPGVDIANNWYPPGTNLERNTQIVTTLLLPKWTPLPTSLKISKSKASQPSNVSQRVITKLSIITEKELWKDSQNSWNQIAQMDPHMKNQKKKKVMDMTSCKIVF